MRYSGKRLTGGLSKPGMGRRISTAITRIVRLKQQGGTAWIVALAWSILEIKMTAKQKTKESEDLALTKAAPLLLAACKAVVEEDRFRGSFLMRKRIVAMEEAIAVAEGGMVDPGD